MRGCGGPSLPVPTERHVPNAAGGVDRVITEIVQVPVGFAVLGWLAALCAVAGVAALVVGFFVPFVPRKAALSCIVLAVGLWFLQGLLERWMGAFLWVGGIAALIAVAVAAYPWVVCGVRWAQDRAGDRLARSGDARAGVALRARAYGITGDTKAEKNKRKAMLASYPEARP